MFFINRYLLSRHGISLLQRIIFFISAVSPYGFVIALLSIYFHFRIVFGYFPVYGDRDQPQQFSFYPYYDSIIEYSFLIELGALPILISFILIKIFLPEKLIKWRTILLGSVGHIIVLLLFFSGIFEWYLD